MPRKQNEFYWLDRINERNQRNTNLTIQETEQQLKRIYSKEAIALQNEIVKVFGKMLSDEMFQGEYMMNDIYRNDRYWQLLDYINERLRVLGGKELKITEPALIKIYEDTKKLIDEEMPSSIKPAFVVPQMIDAKQVVHQTWCLDGKEFSDRIWQDKTKLLAHLKKDMSDFLVRGKGAWEIAEKLANDLDTHSYNAFRIVRTEGTHLITKGKTDRYQEMGFTKGKYIGIHCCKECQKNDDKIFTLAELEHMIPVHPNCKCTFVPVRDRSLTI